MKVEDVDRKIFEQRLKEGKETENLCNEFGLSKKQCSYLRCKLGYGRENRTDVFDRMNITKEELEKELKTKSMTQIALDMGYSKNHIWKLINRHGIVSDRKKKGMRKADYIRGVVKAFDRPKFTTLSSNLYSNNSNHNQIRVPVSPISNEVVYSDSYREWAYKRYVGTMLYYFKKYSEMVEFDQICEKIKRGEYDFEQAAKTNVAGKDNNTNRKPTFQDKAGTKKEN